MPIEDEQIGAAQIAQKAGMASVAMRQGEVLEEPGHALVEDQPVVATGLVAECRRQPTFADFGRTGQSQIVVGGDPFALDQLLEKGAAKTAGIAIIDILGMRRHCGCLSGAFSRLRIVRHLALLAKLS